MMESNGGGVDQPEWIPSFGVDLFGFGRQTGLISLASRFSSRTSSTLKTAMSLPSSTPTSASKSGCLIMSSTWRSTLYFSSLKFFGVGPVSHSPQRMTTSSGSISAVLGLLPHLRESSLQPDGPGVQQHASNLAPPGSLSLQR